jgi:hypothetical protein
MVVSDLKTVKKPKERVRQGQKHVSWRGNQCTKNSCPSLYQKTRSSRDSKESESKDSKESKAEKRKSRKKNKSKNKDRNKDRKDRDKGTKYYLYFQLSNSDLVPSREELREAVKTKPSKGS